ncbi:hypothetical conserved protein (plasmid) [Rhizobium etli CFN 42]|nr:hypothetical conserved protein [Rhizobium etli CFN 42]
MALRPSCGDKTDALGLHSRPAKCQAVGRNSHALHQLPIRRKSSSDPNRACCRRRLIDLPSTPTTGTWRPPIAAPERYSDMEKPRSKAALWLLIIPYIGLLWPAFYNLREPSLFGFPFFYWYQLLWVPITATLTWIAYRSVRHDD